MYPDGDARAEILDLLVKAGADVDAIDASGRTPLLVACQNASASLIERFLDYEPQLATRDPEGRDALILAALGSPSAVAVLLAKHADPRSTDVHGKSARDYALTCGFDHAVRALDDALGDSRGGSPNNAVQPTRKARG
jgi:ankyrin repeat protein